MKYIIFLGFLMGILSAGYKLASSMGSEFNFGAAAYFMIMAIGALVTYVVIKESNS